MKTLDDKTLNEMSKEELIEAYKELLSQCISLEATVAEKNLIIKKYHFDRFVSKRDNAYKEKEEKPNADEAKAGTDGGDKPKSRHTGRPAGSTNFSQVDLEAASRKNPTITLDPLEGLPEDEKGRYYIVSNGQTYMLEYCEARLSVYKVVRPVYKKKGTENEFLSEPSHARHATASPARACLPTSS